MNNAKHDKTLAIDVLLATCNSERFLTAQLDSLLNQSCDGFRILVRDAGSQDRTCSILRKLQAENPDRIKLLPPARANAAENFGALMEAAEADLVMFSDHDDAWLPDKIARTLEKYREAEARWGAETPILVFTDSKIVDENLQELHPSMLRWQNLNPRILSLRRLLVQNVPSGNVMLLNRALLDLARPLPERAVMHDHWIALVAAAFGKIVFLDEPTLLYRQHQSNVFGATHYSLSFFVRKLFQGRRALQERFNRNVRQGAAFLERFGNRLSSEDRAMLQDFSNMEAMGFFAKRRIIVRRGLWKNGLLRNLGMLLFL